MRNSIKRGAVIGGALLAVGVAAPAFAAPGAHGNGVGGCVDNLYGNATNPRPAERRRESAPGVLTQRPRPRATPPRRWDSCHWARSTHIVRTRSHLRTVDSRPFTTVA